MKVFLSLVALVCSVVTARTIPDFSKQFNWTACGECSHNGTYQVRSIYPNEISFVPTVGTIFVSSSNHAIVIKATGSDGGDQYVLDSGYYFVESGVCFTNPDYNYSDMVDRYTQLRQADVTEAVLPILETTMWHGLVRDGGACSVYLSSYIRTLNLNDHLLTLMYTQMLAPAPNHNVSKAQIGITVTQSSNGVNLTDITLPAVCTSKVNKVIRIPNKFTQSHIFAKYAHLTVLPYCPVYVPDGLDYVLVK